MNEDDDLSPELEKHLRKYFKRSGIRRMYRLERPMNGSTLMLEFVIRGRVLFEVDLWKRKKGLFTEDE
jgi:hypothetical protein